MRITVRLFANLRELTGVSETAIDVPDSASAGEASAVLAARFPKIASLLPRCAYAVNREYAPKSTLLNDGDELALIPPVSGG